MFYTGARTALSRGALKSSCQAFVSLNHDCCAAVKNGGTFGNNMSEFCGVFLALPGVSCDRFTGANLNSDQFFLSHCHADHMVGLDPGLVTTLSRKNTVRVNHRIYCSAISKTFLVKKFGLDERFVKVLPSNQPVVIDVFDKSKAAMFKLKVTAIPANHCPGSVM